MEIDSGRVDDADDVADLWVSLAEEQRRYGSHVLPERNRASIRETASRYAATDRLFVAREDERRGGSERAIVGFVTFNVENGQIGKDVVQGVVENLYVAPDHRNEGVGGDLLAAAERSLVDRGVDAVVLEALAENEDARRFYRRHGYDVHRVSMEKSVE